MGKIDTAPLSLSAPVAIVGGGPAGLAAALVLGQAGIPVTLAAPVPASDPRTTALMEGSLGLLRRIDAWDGLAPHTGALRTMRLVDATRRLLRAPDVCFSASEAGLEAFGHNIPNQLLVDALREKLRDCTSVTALDSTVAALRPAEGGVDLTLADGRTFAAQLVIGADGLTSPSRMAAGITARQKHLDQTAFVVNVTHTVPHGDISTEFHTEHGPFTLVPLPGLRASIVAVGRPADVERYMGMNDANLGVELTRRSGGVLGALTVDGPRGARPLVRLSVSRLAQNRIALVGEAAHVLPPIGAQGLNLGLRDVSALTDLIIAAHRAGDDVGSETVLSAYDRARRGDVCQRGLAVDLFNRSLLSPLLPVQIARAAGLHALKGIGPLRRLAMRSGLGS